MHIDILKSTHLWAIYDQANKIVIGYSPSSSFYQQDFFSAMVILFTVDSLIGWLEHSIYLDSSWRYKNDINMPLTLIVISRWWGQDEWIEALLPALETLQRGGESSQRMIPGVALVFKNITAKTLAQFIYEVRYEIYQ